MMQLEGPPPLSAAFALFSSARCVFLQSSTPSSSFLTPSFFAASRSIHQLSRRKPPLRRISSINSGATEIIPASDNGSGSTVISALLLAAFIFLSLLTVGVVYLAVQDFLQKRETEKFEKEQSEKMKKSGKKKKVRARDGPRGFGQKIDEEEDI